MNCPVCKNNDLVNKELETNLQSCSCTECGGTWIQAFQYWRWRDTTGADLPEKSAAEGANLPLNEPRGGKFCPECKHALMPYKVGHDTGFSLNRCANCGGVWFDRNEWEVLKSRNLHDDVHFIFSQAWQSDIRHTEQAKAMDKIWRQKLGDNQFEEVKRIQTWIEEQPSREEIYSYLVNFRPKR